MEVSTGIKPPEKAPRPKPAETAKRVVDKLASKASELRRKTILTTGAAAIMFITACGPAGAVPPEGMQQPPPPAASEPGLATRALGAYGDFIKAAGPPLDSVAAAAGQTIADITPQGVKDNLAWEKDRAEAAGVRHAETVGVTIDKVAQEAENIAQRARIGIIGALGGTPNE